MEKQIYLVRGKEGESYPGFKGRILSLLDNVVQKADPYKLRVTLTEEAPPRISVIPFRKRKIAAISIFKDDNEPLGFLLKEDGIEGGYVVKQALPVTYEKTWKNGDPTPGVCLLTLFSRKKGLDYQAFINRWHNSHTPMSLRIHPLWHYDRNVVEHHLSEHSYGWDGIVEEHFRTRKELLNPVRFFGNNIFKMAYHMWEVYQDTRSFLDYKTIEPYFVREYHVKS